MAGQTHEPPVQHLAAPLLLRASCEKIHPVLQCKHMNTDTFSVRLNHETKARLQKLAKSTGRSRAFLAAEAIQEYLDINEWQVAGVIGAIASLERGKGVPHNRIKEWVASWETSKERRVPKAA
jgi:RHH-type transcriptional regulator, rel operon repressor / antitoxin RelB